MNPTKFLIQKTNPKSKILKKNVQPTVMMKCPAAGTLHKNVIGQKSFATSDFDCCCE
jgi:hypothetical protein